MLGELYYLNASLPSLAPEGPAPMTGDAFLSLCRGGLDESGFEALRVSRLREESPSPSGRAPRALSPWRRWLAFDRGLRGRLARLRAEKLGWEEAATSAGAAEDGTVIREAAQCAVEDSNPLAAELALFHVRWRFLDELDRESFMTRDNLVVYFLKLQLLEWRAGLIEEGGRQTLSDLRRIVETELPGAESFSPPETQTETPGAAAS